jgi:hypothetical protein
MMLLCVAGMLFVVSNMWLSAVYVARSAPAKCACMCVMSLLAFTSLSMSWLDMQGIKNYAGCAHVC